MSARTRDTNTVKLTYLLYLVGLFTAVPIIVGLIVAYVARAGSSSGAHTHYDFLIRTFWLGVVGFVLAAIATAILAITIILAWIPFTLLWIWFVVRCVTGLLIVMRNERHPEPNTLGWA